MPAFERALAEDERLVRKIADNLPVRIAYCDAEGRYRFVNQAHCQRFGRTREEILGRTRSELTCGEADATVLPRVAAVLAGEVQHFEYEETVAGEVRRIESRLTPDRSEAGEVIGFFSIGEDVTERARVQAALKESEALLSRTGRVAGVGGWQYDLATGTVVWSHQTRRIHEVGPDFVPTLETAIAFYAPQARQTIADAVRCGIEHGQPWDLELPLVTATGRAIWVRAVGEVESAQGRPARLIGALQDITEIHAARDELRRLNAEQTAMLDNEIVGIVKLRDRVAVWRNRALETMFGYGPGELSGQPARLLYADDESYLQLGRDAYPTLLAGGHYRTQLQMRRKSGELIWVDLSGTRLSPASRETLWLMIDITPLKDRERQVEQIAFHDALTGLPNRLLLADRMAQSIAVLKERLNRAMAVCYLDLDGFKAVNDSLGHDAGDRLLKEVASRLEACIRANDTVSRIGGDEFVLLLAPLDHPDDWRGILGRVVASVNEPIALGDDHAARVSASIGVALFPAHATEAPELLSRADRAMFEAKRRGRNQICLHQPEPAAA